MRDLEKFICNREILLPDLIKIVIIYFWEGYGYDVYIAG